MTKVYKPTRLVITDQFYSKSKLLREHFEERFADPRSTARKRFVWDYWHVPGQYTLLRTPAWEFFPEEIYVPFHEHLVEWGRRVLGCHDISPPWLSLYVEGCNQETHADLPHGPWAWVYSLSPLKKNQKNRPFLGGETCLALEPLLNYWKDYSARSASGMLNENESLWEKISPVQNRLTVFDPRIPHQVSEVRGVRDPLLGRLVIHGWFVQPRPFIEGKITSRRVEKWIEVCSDFIQNYLGSGVSLNGVLTLRIETGKTGSVSSVKILTSSLLSPEGVGGGLAVVQPLASALQKLLRSQRAGGAGVVTLPLVFGTFEMPSSES